MVKPEPRVGQALRHTETVLRLRKRVSSFKDRDAPKLPKNKVDGRRQKKWKDMDKYRKATLQRQVSARKTFWRQKAAKSGRTDRLKRLGEPFNGSRVVIVKRKGVHIRKPFIIRKLLKNLKLKKANQARLVLPNSDKKRLMINVLWPYIEVTQPTEGEVRELMQTRMQIKVVSKEGKTMKKTLSSNVPVEEALGDLDLICIEDLVDQLAGNKEHSETVLDHLQPFTLTKRTGKFIPNPLNRAVGMSEHVQK